MGRIISYLKDAAVKDGIQDDQISNMVNSINEAYRNEGYQLNLFRTGLRSEDANFAISEKK